jgi:hypothetical protein
MNENVGHIISRLSWDTSFDKKDSAFELQERLSGWSRINMPKEIVNVFDKMCPPEQTWRIKFMEIDLGEIGYDDLEFELTTKLRKQLNEKLIDLIIYANRGNNNIEVLNKDISHIHLIMDFLLSGFMPWNYKPVDGTVNQMLGYQLQNNRRNVIAMLRDVGVTHQNVRKRMAWQLSEPNIIKIIEGLEPNNHIQIIDFSNELTKIQERETIVQTSITDFKKNLWFWVFNYLLTERGTIFNKVAFMKSNIRQMADHYNISYDELLELIELAIVEVSKKSDIKADFILTLKALLKENDSASKKNNLPNENTVDFWHILERYFKDQSLRKSESHKVEFNELVINLAKLNRSRFDRLISSLGEAENLWQDVINDLNNTALDTIFSVLCETKSTILVESIYFLDKLSRATTLAIETKVLWEIGIKFLQSHKSASFDNKIFLNYCISDLAKRKQLTKEYIIDQLTGAKIQSTVKTMLNLEIYADITSIFLSEISQKNSIASVAHLKDLIGTFSIQLNSRAIDKELFTSFQKSIAKNMQLNPGAALKALMEYPDKNNLQKLVPYLINDYTASLLMKHAAKGTSLILLSVQRILNEFKANKEMGKLAILIEENLMMLGLHAIIFHPELTGEKFLEFLLKALSTLTPTPQFEKFDFFIEKLTGDGKLSSCGISVAFSDKIKEQYRSAGSQFDGKHADQIIDPSIIKLAGIEIVPTSVQNQQVRLRNGDRISGDNIFRLIERCFAECSETITYNGIEFHLSELIDLGLDLKPLELRRIISNTQVSNKLIDMLKRWVSFSRFSLWIMSDVHGPANEALEAMRLLYDIIHHIASSQLADEILSNCWKQSWLIIKTSSWSASHLKRLVQESFHLLAKERNANSEFIISEIKEMNIRLTPLLKNALEEYIPAFSTMYLHKTTNEPCKELLSAEHKDQLHDLICQLINHKQTPSWFGGDGGRDAKDLLNEIVVHYPVKLLQVLKRELISEQQMYWLSQSVSFKKLSASISNLDRTQQSLLGIIQKFYLSLGYISVNGVSAKELQYIIFRKVVKAWTSNNWKIISTDNIWNELVWEVCIKRGVSKKEFLLQIEKGKSHFPPSLQISFEYLKDYDRSSGFEQNKAVISKPLKQILQKKYAPSIMKAGIAIRNAGVVLVNNYIPVLFERLGIIRDKQFSAIEAQERAVHYLQYVVTGLSSTEESLLPLNKVLCGLPLSHPVQGGIDISETHIKLIEDLILNAIGHWPVIGQCSLNGFRGNWLVRDGLLMEHDDKWELTVEKRAYDALINKFPFSFSIIKYQWMDKPLHVNWAY